ncbi:multicopper oxidase domain-containing protein [Agromyces atrinae]|uniref:multicopper oxidase domain-containing protein n=1 Tax=Agromyces atrinae TaxID=592376 RepID=UPI001F57E6FB|nr:multicopper oxidase domain-containing protein [Agromyces atrinae]MCI2957717.1 multicopper oxidase domain-containing protein [Agromyces atrinae]
MSRRTRYVLMNALVGFWFVVTGVVVIAHRFLPESGWLLIHLTLLGAASTAILIWSQHFADTLTRRAGPGGARALTGRLVAHTLGAVLVVVGVLSATSVIAIIGAAFVAVNALLHGILLAVQARGALPSRFAPLVRYYVAAAATFVVGATIGGLLSTGPAGQTAARLVVAHVSLNLFGWIGLTVIGTAVLLWPTILHARIEPGADAGARHALPTLLVGLAILVAAAGFGATVLVTVGLVVWLAGLARVGVHAVLQARAMPPGTFAGWSVGAGLLWAAGSAAWLAVGAATTTEWSVLLDRLDALLIPFVAGFVVQVLVGALSFLLPVVVGGSPKASKVAAVELDRAAPFRVVVVNGGLLLFLLPVPSVAKVLLSLLVFGVLVAFLVLAVRAVVLSRRARRAEGDTPDLSRVVSLGDPGRAAEPRRSRTGLVAAAIGVLMFTVTAGIAVDPAAAGIGTAAVTDVAATGETTRVTVVVEGMRFTPDVIEVPRGDRLVIELHNTGVDVHDLTIENGARTERIAVGGTATLDVGIIGTDLEGWCSVAGHRQMGMVLDIVAIGDGPAPSPEPTPTDDAGGAHSAHDSSASAPGGDPVDLDLMREYDDDFDSRDATLAPASDETVHRVDLTVTEQVTEVAPGVTQTLWTFGGTAPGPVLRGRIGDVFEITLTNDGSIGHSIDFHAGALAPAEPMRTIQPGQSLVYRFTAERAGIWMYHCSTMPMSSHIANGMFGAVIIDPPDLAPVDREYVLVQSEYYLGPEGGEVDAAKIARDEPDLVVFNGAANQYRSDPLPASVGERVRVWVLDAGPSRSSSFHVIGGQFDTVWLEGDYRLRPGAGGSQALGLFAAQGGFVELAFPEEGDYPFVSHMMVDAERGAAGLFRVAP